MQLLLATTKRMANCCKPMIVCIVYTDCVIYHLSLISKSNKNGSAVLILCSYWYTHWDAQEPWNQVIERACWYHKQSFHGQAPSSVHKGMELLTILCDDCCPVHWHEICSLWNLSKLGSAETAPTPWNQFSTCGFQWKSLVENCILQVVILSSKSLNYVWCLEH
jgi:hypothetical protein